MIARVRSNGDVEGGGAYFSDPKTSLSFIPSGCTVLDCTLGGGWPLGRISNVVGDKSTGKTLLAIEAAANFAQQYPKGLIWYRESEAAFEKGYAEALGMPLSRVNFGDKGKRWITVEDIFEDLEAATKEARKRKQPGFYVVDSLDALTTKIDLAREFGEQTYRTDKPTMMGELFRKLTQPVEETQIHLMIVSQVRAKIGLSFGDKTSRSGGGALDFYASQVLYLSHLKQLVRTIKGVKRATGVRIRARCKKNKIGLPFRECEFKINFGYGMQDLDASVEWLKEVGRLKDLTKLTADDYLGDCDDLSDEAFVERSREVSALAEIIWREIDKSFLPTRKKYA